jgi:hypothetical protein
MNPRLRHPTPSWIPRVFFSAALAALALGSSHAQVVPNAGFEADTFTVFPGYISDNGPVTGWSSPAPASAGINPSGGSPFADNGAIPEGSKVAFIQSNGGESSLDTTITGLTPGQKYQLGFRVNARSGGVPLLSVSVDGAVLGAAPVEPVGGAAPYRYVGLYFDAAAAEATLSFANTAGGDTTVLIDDVTVTPTTEEWRVTPWLDDATTGLDAAFVYTHAYNFGSAAGASINEVAFTGVAGGNPAVPGRLTTTGLNGVFTNDGNSLGDGSRAIANDFVYNGFPSSFKLSGLVPNREYVASLFSVGWEAAGRVITFRNGTRQYTVDQDIYGNDNGVRIDHSYTADANGEVTLFTHPLGAGSFHIYAITNREAVVAPGLAFSSQPTNVIGVVGDSVELRATVSGARPVTYQWLRDGNPVAGATASTLSWNLVDGASSGFFSLRATNANGSITSLSAFVSVYEAVPAGRVFNTGVDASGVPVPDGELDPHYQLLTNADNPGVTEAFVQDSTVFPIVAGPWLAVSDTSAWIGPRFNTSGAAGLSSDAGEGGGTYVYRTTIDLTGRPPGFILRGNYATDNEGRAIRINGQPLPGVAPSAGFGGYTSFVFDSEAFPAGTIVAGPNTLDFVVVNVDAAAGYTGLRVDGLELISVPAGLAPVIVTAPQSADVVTGSSHTLRVQAYGTANLTYQWARNNTPIAGATSSTYTIPSFNTSLAGSYTVTVTNSVNTVTSPAAVLTALNVPPSILTQPQAQLAGVGDSVSFSVVADGSAPFTYQWRRNGDPLAGQTTATLTLAGVTDAAAGSYSVIVTNAYGTVTSTEAALTVLPVVPGVFATGVDATGAALPDGEADPHYLLLFNPDGENEIAATVHNSTVFPIVAGPWVANTDTAKWIAPQFDTVGSAGEAADAGAGPGVYVYRTTFDLTGFNPATARLVGSWAIDNLGVAIRLNGADTGLTNNAGFAQLTNFSLAEGTAPFQAGVNTLDFVVQNQTVAVGYTGLYVTGLRILASAGSPPAVLPQVTITFNASNQPVLTFTGTAGRTYTIQRSATLATASWSAIGTATAAGDGSVSFTDTAPLLGTGYYRVVIPTP